MARRDRSRRRRPRVQQGRRAPRRGGDDDVRRARAHHGTTACQPTRQGVARAIRSRDGTAAELSVARRHRHGGAYGVSRLERGGGIRLGDISQGFLAATHLN